MVDIEKIMQEIRNEISEKNLDKEILSFEECPVKAINNYSDNLNEDFDIQFYVDNIDKMNRTCVIQPNRPITGNPIFVFIKKVIRWFVRFYFEPAINDQTEFNVYSVRVANSVRNYILKAKQNEEKIEEMAKRIEILEKQLDKK